ncbi:transport between ER and Golgi ATPase protein [Gnomoniopsis sp. IMI 355080]|nr:transport between ER and Golgi ATPase protein [Gnomoniopsis sp. IMI 355080]
MSLFGGRGGLPSDPRSSARSYGGQPPPPQPPRGSYGQDPSRMPPPQRQPAPQASPRGQGRRQLDVTNMNGIPKGTRDDNFIFANAAAVDAQDWGLAPMAEVILRVAGDRLGTADYVVHARGFPGLGQGMIAFGEPQRLWLNNISPGDTVVVEEFNPIELGQKSYLGALEIAIEFASKTKATDAPYDQESLAKHFIKCYENQILAPKQQVIMIFQNIPLRCYVSTVELIDMSLEKPQETGSPSDGNPRARGILTRQSEVSFIRAPNSVMKPMNLKGSAKRSANAIVRPDFKFEDLGIGGLDDEFSVIFRRAFASRIFPPNLIEQLGIMHVKGILLYGPPGTGKTLIARQIGKMLQAREPKVINGPEILNKYVGQSEENVRKMFADAEKEYKEKGDESELHVIIFDELDAVCKQRGSGAGGGTGVGDSVVNQLLSKLDGVDQLNNILLIGMTNRKDMIDDALLRPGRLEVQVEISLPDEKGRGQILKIHTSKMRENGRIASDVDLEELAGLTKNFSGAELNGLAKSAASFAFNRHTQAGSMAAVGKDVNNLVITRQDFLGALSEVTPAFGVSDEELTKSIIYGIIHFSPSIDQIINSCMVYLDGLRNPNSKSPKFSLLFHGPDGSGKTSLASHIAKASEFPFVKIISPEALVMYRDEMAKRDHIHKIFTDAIKSPLSIVIV